MKVELRARLFADRTSQFWLLGFLQRALDDRLFLSVRSPNADAYKAWLAQLPRAVRDAWETVLTTTTRYEAVARLKMVAVDAIAESDWGRLCLSPGDAMTLVDAPFRLMVENARFDRAFFLACLTAEERALIERLERKDRLFFYGGGGIGELRQLVVEQVAQKPHRSLTHMILFDSDAGAPGEVSEAAVSLSGDCTSLGLRFHCLKRRAIENYLPKGALYDFLSGLSPKQRAKRRRRVEAFLRMSDAQRHHFRMKTGWAKQMTVAEQALYNGLDNDIVEALSAGVSGKLSEVYRLADAERLRNQLLSDGGVAELRPFINDLLTIIRTPNV